MELTHGSLFAGIGGFDLGFERADFKTLWQVEIDDYATKVLEKNFPQAQRFRDIRTVHGVMAHTKRDRWNADNRRQSLSHQDGNNSTHESGREVKQSGIACRSCLPTPTVLTGGFPCQPFSVAGKQRGKNDDRYLWPEMLRVIEEVRPHFVVAENVPGIIKLALDQVLSDLEGIGYTCGAVTVPACAVDASHRRDRVWIVCHTEHAGQLAAEISRSPATGSDSGKARQKQACKPARPSKQYEAVADGSITGLEGREWGTSERTRPARKGWWLPEPNVGRVAHGIPRRMDRLKCLGNAVVPQIAEFIAWQIRKVIEDGCCGLEHRLQSWMN